VSWATRNRQSQTAYLVLQTEGALSVYEATGWSPGIAV